MNKIETVMVDSTAISSAEYNLKDESMIVFFNNQSIYKYNSVPLFYWRGLFDSVSKGKFLNNFIFGNFNYNRLS
jgi:hypothetical protein